MRQTLVFAGLLAVLLAGNEAHAQFQNKSIGLSVGFVDLLSQNAAAGAPIQWALPFGVTFTYYMENHFDLVFEMDGIIAHTSATNDPNIWGLNVTPIGVRYLFMEDTFRPYLGIDASYLHFFSNDTNPQVIGSSGSSNYIGVGPNGGFDYFIADNLSLGIKARINVYLTLNAVDASFDATARIATYF